MQSLHISPETVHEAVSLLQARCLTITSNCHMHTHTHKHTHTHTLSVLTSIISCNLFMPLCILDKSLLWFPAVEEMNHNTLLAAPQLNKCVTCTLAAVD